MTQVELDRTNEKSNEAEARIQELEEQLNVVGQNMKTLELSETNALKRHEECEEKIRCVCVCVYVCVYVWVCGCVCVYFIY